MRVDARHDPASAFVVAEELVCNPRRPVLTPVRPTHTLVPGGGSRWSCSQ
jgi:hypothetical protein